MAELKTLNADNFKSLEVLDQVAETAKASLDNVNAAIASGTDDLEIKEARRGFPTLGEKIDDVTIYKGETVPGYLPAGALWLDTSDESFQGTVFEEFDGKLTQHDADLEKVNVDLAQTMQQTFHVSKYCVGDGVTDDCNNLLTLANEVNALPKETNAIVEFNVPSLLLTKPINITKSNVDIRYNL